MRTTLFLQVVFFVGTSRTGQAVSYSLFSIIDFLVKSPLVVRGCVCGCVCVGVCGCVCVWVCSVCGVGGAHLYSKD